MNKLIKLANVFNKAFVLINFFTVNNKKKFVWVIFLTTVLGFIEMINVAALLPLLNALNRTMQSNILSQYNFDRVLSLILKELEMSEIAFASCFLLFVTLLSFTYKLYFFWYSHNFSANLMLHQKQKVFVTLNKCEYYFFNNASRGELIQIATSATSEISTFIDSFIRFVSQGLTIFFLFTYMFWKSHHLALIIVTVSFLYLSIIKLCSHKFVILPSKARQFYLIEETQLYNEFIGGIRSIRIFQAAGVWSKKINYILEQSIIHLNKIHFGNVTISLISPLFMGIAIAFFGIYASSLETPRLHELAPLLVTFVVAITRISAALSSLGNSYSSFASSYVASKSSYNFVTQTPLIKKPLGKTKNPTFTFKDKIVFKNVSFAYPGKKYNVISNLNLVVRRGSSLGILGKSGTGKTTLVNLLTNLYTPTKGSIELDGIAINNIPESNYNNLFAIVSQDSFLMHGSILENITFGRKFRMQEINTVAKLANIHSFIESLPEKYNTSVGDNGIQLSGGQKQRIAIARALLFRPQILILDEPTSALDVKNESKIISNIKNYMKAITIITITHKKELLKNYDQVFYFH